MEFLKELLKDHDGLYDQIEKALKGKKDVKLANLASGEYVSKGKFTALETNVTELKDSIKKRDEELTALKTSAGDNEGLTNKIEEMQTSHTKRTEELENSLLATQKTGAIALAIEQAKPKDANASRAILALIDQKAVTVKVTDDGESIIGLNDQLDKIKEDSSYFFGEVSDPKGGGGNNNPAGDDDDDPAEADEEGFRKAAFGSTNRQVTKSE